MEYTSYRKKTLLNAIWLTAIVSAFIILFLFNPSSSKLFPPCPVNWLSGFYCPGCGALRAVHNLLHGRLATAMSLNPLMVVSIPIVGFMIVKPAWLYKRWVPWVLLAVLVSYTIARNINLFPFSLLAPG